MKTIEMQRLLNEANHLLDDIEATIEAMFNAAMSVQRDKITDI